MVSLSLTSLRVVFASLLFPSSRGVYHGEQTDLSTLLDRLNALETKVATLEILKDEVVALTTELESQKELARRSRFLAGDECLLTFLNDTGTPTCSVGYQLIAGACSDWIRLNALMLSSCLVSSRLVVVLL